MRLVISEELGNSISFRGIQFFVKVSNTLTKTFYYFWIRKGRFVFFTFVFQICNDAFMDIFIQLDEVFCRILGKLGRVFPQANFKICPAGFLSRLRIFNGHIVVDFFFESLNSFVFISNSGRLIFVPFVKPAIRSIQTCGNIKSVPH